MDHKALATLRTQSQPRGRRARWIAELKNYQFHAKHFPEKENYMADYLSRYPVRKLLQMIKEDVRIPKFVEVVLYNKKGIWLSVRFNKLMKGSLQVVFGKADEQESIIAAKREVKEETDLLVTQLQWLVNDPQYDCDIYLCDIEKFKLRRSELNKSSAWRHYSYDAFARLSTQRCTTLSLTRYWKDIVESCKAALVIKEENRHLRNMRDQTVNVLDDWVHAPFQTTWADEEEKSLEPIINNETIPYSYINYIYRGKNWECPVCGITVDIIIARYAKDCT